MKTYQETLDYLYSRLPMFQRSGPAAYKGSLDNTIKLCSSLGNPQDAFASIHVAGTNGKGSVSHMLAAVLHQAGYKTGLYTSPHLKDFRERIRVNGKMISEEKVIRFTEKIEPLCEEIQPSFFEVTVAMALDYFMEEQVDIAVIETGMGGRLDSTNIIRPLLAVITNIGYDHTTFLGNTLEAIAGEKAGIIKSGAPVVIGRWQPETAPVFLAAARKNEAPLHFADQHWNVYLSDRQQPAPGKLNVDVSADSNPAGILQISCDLSGRYQLENIATAMMALKQLEHKLKIDSRAVASGLSSVKELTGLRGRWETLQESPLVICDTGHNEDGIRHVVAQLKQLKKQKLHMVIGVVSDKDPAAVLSLLPAEAAYYFCQASIPRAMDAALLAEKAAAQGLQGQVIADVRQALEQAIAAADPELDVVFVGGSTFVVAEVI